MAEEYTTYKLIVLFLLQNAGAKLTNSQLLELILDNDRMNYFHLQQAIAELVDARLADKQTVSNVTFYSITEDGKQALSYFEDELSEERKKELLASLEGSGFQVPSQILSPAEYYPDGAGTFTVRCQIVEKTSRLLDLTMDVPSEEAARGICHAWPLKSSKIYEKIMEELL